MNLLDIAQRRIPPEPWAEGDNIPWNDPGFSARMLREHLTQEHDLASRKTALIDAHVTWISRNALERSPSSILDLACGPGLYAKRFAEMGHRVHGVDFSPASIEFARRECADPGLEATFDLADLRDAKFGFGYDAALLIYGEFHVFRREEATSLLERIASSLAPGAPLILELTPLERLSQEEAPVWSTYPEGGLFSDGPYLQLSEWFWDADRHAATRRWFIVDPGSGEVERYAASYQAYTRDELTQLVCNAGFRAPEFHAHLGEPTPGQEHLVLIAKKTS